MIQRFTGQLPSWARPNHPVLRHVLGNASPRPHWRVRYARALAVVLLGGILLFIGYLAATGIFDHDTGQNPVESINAVLYFPLLAAQVVLRIVAFTLTAGVVGEQIRFGNWDNLRATENGAELTMRARWVSVFYRVRGLFAVIIGLRVILIGAILYDLTSFQGRHLDLFIVGITPEVPLILAVLLLSFLMTSSLLLPLTGAGFDASLGLLVSSLVQQRTYGSMMQALFILARVAVTAIFVFAATSFMEGSLPATDLGGWLLLFTFAAVGDWGLAFLYLGRYGEIWATVPYGIFLGLALLAFSLIQAALADAILLFATRRAQRRG